MIQPVPYELFAVIGNPVAHSLSPIMMRAAFENLGRRAVYVALQCDDLSEDLEVLRKAGFRGLSVTIPHKERAFQLAQRLDETARAIGAVNTLRRTPEGWEGCNTDWLGATLALGQTTSLRGKHALVLGAGGAARAVVYGLLREGVHVTVANRSVGRGKALAHSLNCEFIALADLGSSARTGASPFDIVVQCTSVGLPGTDTTPLVPSTFFHRDMVVLDTVYRPLWTPFLQAAMDAGCRVVHGLEMLLYQGVAQLEWWLECSVAQTDSVRVMKNALWRALDQ